MNTETLERILYTLNQLEVHGKNNLDKLLGCIQVVESALYEVRAEEARAREVSADGR